MIDAINDHELPGFVKVGSYVSSNFDFVEPTDKKSVDDFFIKETRNLISGKEKTYFSIIDDIEYVKEKLAQRGKWVKMARRRYVPKSLDAKSYFFNIENKEIMEEIPKKYYQRKSRHTGYDDSDIIRAIMNGNGEALGYGD